MFSASPHCRCDAFDAAYDIDVAYGAGLRDAAARGVEILSYGCDIDCDSIRLVRPIPWRGAQAANARITA